MEDSKAQFSAKQEIVSVLIYSQKMVIANSSSPVYGTCTWEAYKYRADIQREIPFMTWTVKTDALNLFSCNISHL
jgi:hypothetical protein